MSERFCHWHTAYKCLNRGAKAGLLECVKAGLLLEQPTVQY